MGKKEKNGKKKLFVLDTNVILHDSTCIHSFQDNDVAIPFTVIEEMETFKGGQNSKGFHARKFGRFLDEVCGPNVYNGGFKLSASGGQLSIVLEEKLASIIKANFIFDKPDRRIINTVYCLSEKNPDKTVILVSKDIYMRTKARAVGLLAEDYTTDSVGDIDRLYNGISFMEGIPTAIIDEIYKNNKLELHSLALVRKMTANEFLILRNGQHSVVTKFDHSSNTIIKVCEKTGFNIAPRNVEQICALDILLDPKIQLVTLSGPAGTGKTLLAMGAALELGDKYDHISIARPGVPVSNRDSGYLPGTINEKLTPYMQPIFDNLSVIKRTSKKNEEVIHDKLKFKQLEIESLAHIKGRSIPRTYFVIDEAQDLTPHEVRTIVMRAGEGTKIVFVGDIEQIDHPYLTSETNGLAHIINKMPGQKIFAHVKLEKGERSELSNIGAELL